MPALVAEALKTSGDGSALRALAWSLLRCAVPTALWAQLYHALATKKGAEAGAALYHDCLRCLFQDTGRTLERLVKPFGINAEKLMLAEGGPRHGRGDAFVRALFGAWPLAADGPDIVGRLLARLPVLGQVPLVPTVGGDWRTLAELAAMPAPRGYRLRGGVGLAAEVLVPPPAHWSWLEAVFPGGWEEVPAAIVAGRPAKAPEAAPVVTRPAPEPVAEPASVAMTAVTEPTPVAGPVAEAAVPVLEAAPQAVPPSLQLLERIHEILRGMHLELDLGRVRIADRDGSAPTHQDPRGVVIDLRHPLVQRALASEDPVWDLFLATAVFGALNRLLEEVTNDHETNFVLRLMARLR